MFLVPWLESFQWIRNHAPYRIFQKRRLNFITIHYLYIISMTILTSILLYPAGTLSYTDALFFASGCATQSGLNTVNVNDLHIYQQVILYLVPMFCTPIFIHSFVVYVRLYWFERRFQNIVRDAHNFRRSRSRSKTELKDEPGPRSEEQGVRGRSIVVLHQKTAKKTIANGEPLEGGDASGTVSSSSQEKSPENPSLPFHRDITFADELPRSPEAAVASSVIPNHLSPEQHIAIRENQRNPKDKSTLRIPGPKDFDRGREPEALEYVDGVSASNAAATAPPESDLTPRTHTEDYRFTTNNLNSVSTPFKLNPTNLPKLNNAKSEAQNMFNAPTEDIQPLPARMKARTGTFSSLKEWASKETETVAPYLSWQPTIGRNSAFVDLTEEQREELGGIEYRSLKTLAVVLATYYFCFHLLGVVIMLPWILKASTWGSIVEEDGIRRTWWAIFSPASMFNDLGFTLTPDSFQSFQKAILPLITGSYLIIVGNTGFPCMLRLVIWISSKISRRGSALWEEFMFLLDHPRRCFTLLFPSTATWWLFWILVALNGIDIIFFIILDLNDESINSINPPGYRVLNGLFQAASTRTAGFASVNLADLHPGIQVSYMIMMYISVFPIAISMRRTNVYEEKSLGIYSSLSEDVEDEKEPSYVGAHLRRQLSFDLWYIFLGLFIIAIAEGKRLENTNEYAFTLFSVLFEIVSAYGTVGLSLGYPNYSPSFCGKFGVISKLVIIAMQIRGRHRGLPYELDRAILLPSDRLHKQEDTDAAKRAHRTNTDTNIAPLQTGQQHSNVAPSLSKSGSQIQSSDVTGTTGYEKPNGEADGRTPHTGTVRRGVGKVMAEVAGEASR